MWNCFALHQTDHYQQANFMKISKKFFPKVQKMTLTFFFSMFCSLSGISLSWKTLIFGRFISQERTNVHRTAFFLHTPDFSLSKVKALKVVAWKWPSLVFLGVGAILQMWVTSSYIQIWLWPGLIKKNSIPFFQRIRFWPKKCVAVASETALLLFSISYCPKF